MLAITITINMQLFLAGLATGIISVKLLDYAISFYNSKKTEALSSSPSDGNYKTFRTIDLKEYINKKTAEGKNYFLDWYPETNYQCTYRQKPNGNVGYIYYGQSEKYNKSSITFREHMNDVILLDTSYCKMRLTPQQLQYITDAEKAKDVEKAKDA